jgi:hypothetical protein
MRTFSFGAGVQSTAVLVLQALGQLPDPYDVFLFANVGDDSEHPDSLAYFRDVHVPYAEEHGIDLQEVKRVKRDGTSPTLLEDALAQERSIPLPLYLDGGGPGNRTCTGTYKINVIRKWQRQQGSSRDNPAVCGLGISTDEIHRARTASGFDDQVLDYPLIDLGMSRRDCYDTIQQAGLPRAPKSACWFCPFHNREDWRRLKRDRPVLFAKAAELEQVLGDRREMLGKDRMWLTAACKPLDTVIDDQLVFDWPGGPDGCDSGSCFT